MVLSRRRIVLLDGVTSNSSGSQKMWSGIGAGTLHVIGDPWDGATVTIQGSADDGATWGTVDNSVITENTIEPFEAGEINVRAVVSNSGSSTVLYAYLTPQGVYE